MSSPEEPQEAPPKRRRKWLRRFSVLFLLLLLALLWFSGPGSRWTAEKAIASQLEKQGLSGDYQLTGNLASGYELQNVSLTGDGFIQKFSADKTDLDYSLSRITSGKIDALTIEGLTLHLDLDQAPESNNEKPKTEKPLVDTLNGILPFVKPVDLTANNLNVRIKKADFTADLSIGSLTHQAHTDTFLIDSLRNDTSQTEPHTSPPVTITWQKDHLAIDQLDLLPELGLRNLSLNAPSRLDTTLQLTGSDLSVSSDLRTTHSLSLGNTPLDLANVARLAQQDLPLEGTITRLNLTAALAKNGPRILDLDLAGKNISYQENRIASLNLIADLNDQDANLDLTTDFAIGDAFAGAFAAKGTVTLAEELPKSLANLDWTLTSEEIPPFDGTVKWNGEEAALTANTLDQLHLKGHFIPESQTYRATLTSHLADADRLFPGLGKTHLTLEALGDLKDQTHQGNATIESLNYTAKDAPTISASGQAAWNWPESFSFTGLTVQREDLTITSTATWAKGMATVTSLSIKDPNGPLGSGSGKLPLPLSARDFDDLAALDEKIDFDFKLAPFPLARAQDTLRGTASASLNLTGTFAKPLVSGDLNLKQVQDTTLADLPPADFSATLRTENETLFLNGNLREPGGDLLTLTGRLPLHPKQWIENPGSLQKEPLFFDAQTPRLNLQRLQPFLPAIQDLQGTAKVDVSARGTIAKPELAGDADLAVDHARISDSPVSDFRDSRLRLKFRENTITVIPSEITAAGGKINLNGTVTLGETPFINLNLNGSNTLIWRDVDYSIRANPTLTIVGPLDSARIAGKVPLVESIVYKDVEILPFGISTSEAPRPQVPNLSIVNSSKLYSLPEPYTNWPVDLHLVTQDPILIRGNLVTGQLLADTRITGTLGDIQTSGKITSDNLKADLPFSELRVVSGEITLSPNKLTEPNLDVRATSQVSGYEVQIYVGGTVSNPKLTITSEPPLPENEILLLLSTGSAASALNNRSVASQKALQYLIEGLRRRYGKEGSNSIVERLLKNSDQIKLNLGDYNRFSGRHFTSATMDLSEKWAITTSVDDKGATRAMVVFSIRFR
ncbi:MAG: translocation/assembly module TamB domain-containing protein [Verrucomicrobiaceae bacterium]